MTGLAWIVSLIWAVPQGADIRVADVAEFRRVLSAAKPGDRILLEPGDYTGGTHITGISGEPGKPIVISSRDPTKPARFVGGGNAMQLSSVDWITIKNLKMTGQTGNGINIDDGGNRRTPSKGIELRDLVVSELPKGNHDGIKLSGIQSFVVANCRIEKWGGSAVDMVGCANGVIQGCEFRLGGDSGVQAKGGTRNVNVTRCRFESYGERGVNIGGSTGIPFFRPPIEDLLPGKRFEAQNITVEGCTFVGGTVPVAFVGVDGASVRFNTIYHPGRWALRILQETRLPDFVKCRNGVFADNLVVFESGSWSAGGVNIGPDTQPESFRFERNFWYCSDRPEVRQVSLPTREIGASIGLDPQMVDPSSGDLRVRKGSPAEGVGAHAFRD